MKYKEIIQDAWHFTTGNKRVIKWLALPSAILGTIAGIFFFVYQYKSTVTSDLFPENHEESFLFQVFSTYINLFNTDSTLGITITAILIFGILLNLFFPVFTNGAITEFASRSRNGENPSLSNTLSYGLFNFLPLFEYSLVVKTFTITSVIAECLFIMRNFGMGWFEILAIPMGLMFLVSLALTLFFTYTDCFIVIDKKKIFTAMKLSTILVIKHWQHTFLILILMAIISLRIILNILIVLLIPMLIIGITALFFYTAKLYAIGVVVGGVIGLILLIITSYLNATVDVWAKAVWVFSFLELTKKEEKDARGNVITGYESLEMESEAIT